jgi:hypothetical protein
VRNGHSAPGRLLAAKIRVGGRPPASYGHCHLPLTADHYPSSKSKAVPPDKYAVLSDVLDWATDAGYPGYSNAAIDEAFNTWVINTAARDATIWPF